MKTAIRNNFLNQMFSIQKIYLIFIEIYHFYPKERKSENVMSLFVRQGKLCCSHKGFKTSTKSWVNTKKSAQGNSI